MGEPYDLVMSTSARRAIEDRLPEAVAAACLEFVLGPLTAAPHRVGAALRALFEGQWRARRGEYRVRYVVDDDARRVVVLDVEHRRDAYRR